MVKFSFTPSENVTFTLVAKKSNNGPSIAELSGKKVSVIGMRRSGVLTDMVVRLEDPSRPDETWLFNSSKVNDDGVPFRRFTVEQDGTLTGTGFYGDGYVDWFMLFVEECISIANYNGLDQEPEWSVKLEPRLIFATEDELLRSCIRYSCPFGRNFE